MIPFKEHIYECEHCGQQMIHTGETVQIRAVCMSCSPMRVESETGKCQYLLRTFTTKEYLREDKSND